MVNLGAIVSDDECKEMINEIDVNSDGKIDYNGEFKSKLIDSNINNFLFTEFIKLYEDKK